MVKAVLKRNNVMLSEFAQSLNVSRPTLDTYIKNYDDGGRLSNTLFQKIFDFLFGDVRMSNAEFAKRYAYVKEHYGKRVGASIAVMQDRSIYPLLSFANSVLLILTSPKRKSNIFWKRVFESRPPSS